MANEGCLRMITSGSTAATLMVCASGPTKVCRIVQARAAMGFSLCLPSPSYRFPPLDHGKDLSWCVCLGVSAVCPRSATTFSSRPRTDIRANLRPDIDPDTQRGSISPETEDLPQQPAPASPSSPSFDKELSKAVRKTAATFAPRSSTAKKNPATPGSTLYTIFEVQAYASMALGGILSFNLLFPSEEPDLWRLMGMWSVWMLTIPSLRARDCSSKEKDALNYLFLLVPLLNVTIPLVWKSFAAVWSADVLAFFAMYAWKLEWIRWDKAEGGQ